MRVTTTACSLAVAGLLAATAAANAYTGQNLASHARVTMARATQIALHARPGKITDRELESEGGGSGLRYSFDVRASGIVYEVGVDAKTGAVLENDREGAHPD